MATQLSPNTYATKRPNFEIVRNFFAKVRSVFSKFVPRRNTQEESFGTYLAIAENIKQRLRQDQLKSEIRAYSRY